MSNLREKLNHTPTPPPPLESSARYFGDPNPCFARLFLTLSQHSGERKWVSGGERGKLHSVIVA